MLKSKPTIKQMNNLNMIKEVNFKVNWIFQSERTVQYPANHYDLKTLKVRQASLNFFNNNNNYM